MAESPSREQNRSDDSASTAEAMAGGLAARLVSLGPWVGLSVVGLFLIALGHTLVAARSVILPLILAVMLSILFAPVVRVMRRYWIPPTLAAALIVASLLGAFWLTFSTLAAPAEKWLAKAPRQFREVELKLRDLKRPVERMNRATEGVQDLADRATGKSDSKPEVVVAEDDLGQVLLFETGQLLRGLAVVMMLLFLLLAGQDGLLRKIVVVAPTFARKKAVVRAALRVQQDLSRYLLTAVCINLALGAAVGLAMYLLGMPNPWLWGGLACVLNFIPYLGALTTGFIIGLVALTFYDSTGDAVLALLAFFVLTGLEGFLLTPLVQGQRLRLTPVVVFTSVVFGAALWGVPGALLAIPLVASFKIVCEEIEALRPIAVLLSPARPTQAAEKIMAGPAAD